MALRSIQEVCEHKAWLLHAAHVRSNHVHIIVAAKESPEIMMTAFKSYATRALKQTESPSRTKRWSRHGSTRWLWDPEQLAQAVSYVIDGQGTPMALYTAIPNRDRP